VPVRNEVRFIAELCRSSFAQDYPADRIEVIVADGMSTDGTREVLARLQAEHPSLVVVENPGRIVSTGLNIAVARSRGDIIVRIDGHALVAADFVTQNVALLAAPSLFNNLRYDTQTAFEPIGLVNNAPMLLVGRKSIPGTSPKDFVGWIRAQGSKANFAHGGVGTNSHLCAVMMGNVLGFKPTVVAYRGSAPAITDLLAGQIDLLWDQVTNAITQVQSGALHGIAITSKERLEQLKDVPTTAELGMPEVSYTMWHGLYVAKGTPRGAVNALNAALRKALADPGVAAKLKQLGTLPFPDAEMTPESHASLFASDLPRVAKLVESSGIKASEAK
jgi:tripartite-type tricarboxylate transporter receptor subunit TctC